MKMPRIILGGLAFVALTTAMPAHSQSSGLQADFITTQSGTTAVGEYALDTNGRMRFKMSGVIIISDPVEGLVWRVHIPSGAGLQTRLPQVTSSETESSSENSWNDDWSRPQNDWPTVDPQREAENLGARSINGYACNGQLWRIRLPNGAFGDNDPIDIQNELWTSEVFGIKVPILVIIRKGNVEVNRRELRNIRSSTFPATFFRPDPAYTIREE